jgi:hypothetical protein
MSGLPQPHFGYPEITKSPSTGRFSRTSLAQKSLRLFRLQIAELRGFSRAGRRSWHPTAYGEIKAARYAIAKPLLRNGLSRAARSARVPLAEERRGIPIDFPARTLLRRFAGCTDWPSGIEHVANEMRSGP